VSTRPTFGIDRDPGVVAELAPSSCIIEEPMKVHFQGCDYYTDRTPRTCTCALVLARFRLLPDAVAFLGEIVKAIEDGPAHPRLTDAVVMAGTLRDRLRRGIEADAVGEAVEMPLGEFEALTATGALAESIRETFGRNLHKMDRAKDVIEALGRRGWYLRK
jgi:hypothetical protein